MCFGAEGWMRWSPEPTSEVPAQRGGVLGGRGCCHVQRRRQCGRVGTSLVAAAARCGATWPSGYPGSDRTNRRRRAGLLWTLGLALVSPIPSHPAGLCGASLVSRLAGGHRASALRPATWRRTIPETCEGTEPASEWSVSSGERRVTRLIRRYPGADRPVHRSKRVGPTAGRGG